MVRRILIAASLASAVLASASSAWADPGGPASRSVGSPEAKVPPFETVVQAAGTADPDNLIMFCMLGWRGVIWSDANGAQHSYGVPDSSCPVFASFNII